VSRLTSGFIDTDAHGRATGLDGVLAAGDMTAFPIKQGGLVAQQADAVAEASGGAGDDSAISGRPCGGRPPDKISGRYLAPYLSSQVGDAADVMPQGEHAIPIETVLHPMVPNKPSAFGELSDLPPH